MRARDLHALDSGTKLQVNIPKSVLKLFPDLERWQGKIVYSDGKGYVKPAKRSKSRVYFEPRELSLVKE
jgi:hypothetical protein